MAVPQLAIGRSRMGKVPGITVLEPAQAPWIRPGVVVHEPRAPVDDLLARFALDIRDRGFQVAGYVQRNLTDVDQGQQCPAGMEFTDLANGKTVIIDRHADPESLDATTRSLRGAMRDDADLAVIGRFSAFENAAKVMTAAVADGISQGMPVLTSIGGKCVHKWREFVGPGGAMLSPDMASLWNWWGPERLYRDLALGVADDDVRQIVCGPRWLMIQGIWGTGLAYLPAGPKELLAKLPILSRMSLQQLAKLSGSWDPLEMAVGIAAINAHYNRFDLNAEAGNGTRTFTGTKGRIVVIGAFPGLTDILPNAQVIEAAPRHGEYPTIAMDTILPGCAASVVTSSTLINRNLPRVLRLAQHARIALVGAATPLTPRLHNYGIQVLGGLVIDDTNGLATAIRAGALPREFTRFGRYVNLTQEHSPQ